ncbi:hypothetical protein GCM10009527_072310 [Actinomadura nitritigenes]
MVERSSLCGSLMAQSGKSGKITNWGRLKEEPRVSEAHAGGEIARMTREVREPIGPFAHLDELLHSALPRLADPSRRSAP